MTYLSAYAIPGIKRMYVFDTEQEIIEKICNYFKMPKNKVMHRMKGTSDVVYVRDWCFWFLLKTKKSLNEIGKIMNRHHTTVIHSREKTRGYLFYENSSEYKRYREDYEKLCMILNNEMKFETT